MWALFKVLSGLPVLICFSKLAMAAMASATSTSGNTATDPIVVTLELILGQLNIPIGNLHQQKNLNMA